MVLGVLLLQFLLLTLVASQTYPGCPENCGDFSIPFPFGIGEKYCFIEGFEVDCRTRADGNIVPYIPNTEFEITNISIPTGEMTIAVASYMARDCYDRSGLNMKNHTTLSLGTDTPYTFSDTQNKLTALGCDTRVNISGNNNNKNVGCVSICESPDSVTGGSCNGIGCCQTSLPKGLKHYSPQLGSFNNHSSVLGFNPCSYAFVTVQSWFSFGGLSDLSSDYYDRNEGFVPVVLDWVISNQTCKKFRRTTDDACFNQLNTDCYDSINYYRCYCKEGYEGNPYRGGCHDIDDCSLNGSVSICGNYATNSVNPTLSTMLIILAIILLFFIVWCTYTLIHKRWKVVKQKKLRKKYFLQNRGLLLQHLISSDEESTEHTKIFSMKELEKATNNFDETRVLGRGGHGTVYKGLLSDQRIVAIKKSKIVSNDEIDQFINEVATLSRINHRNVVKLYGCCLEAEVPLLVYEFIPNGMLSDHIHSEDNHLSWDDRLRIASESAGALSYLHSAASTTIFHRDVKSSNILLDDNCTAKVADFGASRFVPLNATHVSTIVQGTFGYLDPEYFHTGKLTEKSDVYSFGVILVELLTGKRPLSMHEDMNLSTHFILLFKENRLEDIVDDRVAKGGKEQIQMVAEIAEACLRVRGEERPMMKEVAIELERLRQHNKKHPWIVHHPKESPCLLNSVPTEQIRCNADTSRNYSLERDFMESIDIPR
ncbi:Wall-associated receptor kinase 5 [Acorus calamus]|uniref:Wall-associated receptor kinase 5 n=1 Tax=Acorus calamus TaxID=4465 RepID=A0AAV9CXK8_ACOCL|nr:Wall-associated receptor kinase 5 [Acorus calamus]